MDAREKIEAALAHLKERGVKPMTAAPPVWRLFWRLGVDVPPPHFLGFGPLFVLTGLPYGLAMYLFGVLFLTAIGAPINPGFALMGVFSALFFGALMAGYYRWSASRLGLPSWSRFGPDADAADDSW